MVRGGKILLVFLYQPIHTSLMSRKTKETRGRRAGVSIPLHKFEAMLAALRMNNKEVANLLNKDGADITPQGISYWKTNGRIPEKYLHRLWVELQRQLQHRERDSGDWTAMDIFRNAGVILEPMLPDGSRPDIMSKADFDKAWKTKGATVSKSKATSLKSLTDRQLVEELENRGWNVKLELRRVSNSHQEQEQT